MKAVLDGLADPEVLPRITEVNRGHFEGAAEGRLVVRRCGACGLLFHYPRPRCPGCHSRELAWEQLSGEGRVVVSAVVSRPPWNDLPRAVPYIVALVELVEGPRMLSTIENPADGGVDPGAQVKAVYERVGDLGLVRFVLT